MPRQPIPNRVSEPALARKNMDMSVAKLDAARAILGARTDTEAVDRALAEGRAMGGEAAIAYAHEDS